MKPYVTAVIPMLIRFNKIISIKKAINPAFKRAKYDWSISS